MNIIESDIAFCSVGFGQRYVPMLDRLSESLTKIHPTSKKYIYRDALPPNSRQHEDSMYGFKVHAIQAAIDDGYKKVIWLDAACYLVNDIRNIFQYCEKYGALAVQDASLLSRHALDESLSHFGLTRSEACSLNLYFAGGSFYAFDFDNPWSRDIFDSWKEAEAMGLFGKANDGNPIQNSNYTHGPSCFGCQFQTHRHDEVCFALSLYKHGSTWCLSHECGYCCEDESKRIIVKGHFK
jgi:hypothetical protein